MQAKLPILPKIITRSVSASADNASELDTRKYKPATVNRKLTSISAFCEWARGAELVSANPTDGISQIDEIRSAPKWLDENDPYAFLRAVQEKGKTRDITLMLNTGLRASEVSALTGDDVETSPRKGSLDWR
jgi:integrase/recombinase XerC